MCSTLINTANSFPKWLCHFYFKPTVYEWFNYFISLSKLGIVCLFHLNHYGDCAIESHCDFNLNFPDEVHHPYMCLMAIWKFSSVKCHNFVPACCCLFLKIMLFVIFLLICRNLLYILDMNPLSYVCIVNIYSTL